MKVTKSEKKISLKSRKILKCPNCKYDGRTLFRKRFGGCVAYVCKNCSKDVLLVDSMTGKKIKGPGGSVIHEVIVDWDSVKKSHRKLNKKGRLKNDNTVNIIDHESPVGVPPIKKFNIEDWAQTQGILNLEDEDD